MRGIRISIDAREVREAFRRAPETMRRHVGAGLDEGGELVAREARSLAAESDVTGVLKQSIRVEHIQETVRDVVANSDHARYVEEGTGRFAGKARYYPDPDALFEYLKAHPRSRGFRYSGRAKRPRQELELWLRSRAWAQAIYARGGTKPHPFMGPAAEASEARVRVIVDAAVTRGLAEVFGAG